MLCIAFKVPFSRVQQKIRKFIFHIFEKTLCNQKYCKVSNLNFNNENQSKFVTGSKLSRYNFKLHLKQFKFIGHFFTYSFFMPLSVEFLFSYSRPM